MVAFGILAFRVLPRGHRTRRWAVITFLFVVAEALIGAGLVRFEWVAANVSEARVYVVAFHLVNTFLLLLAMTLAAWFAEREERPEILFSWRSAPLLALALVSVLAVGASGAVTALGDTLVFTAGISPEESPLVARLIASRWYHPAMAAAAFLVVLGVVVRIRAEAGAPARRHGAAVLAVFGAQLLLGAVNVFLKAPVWMQLLHLAVSDLLWILLVLMALEASTTASRRNATASP